MTPSLVLETTRKYHARLLQCTPPQQSQVTDTSRTHRRTESVLELDTNKVQNAEEISHIHLANTTPTPMVMGPPRTRPVCTPLRYPYPTCTTLAYARPYWIAHDAFLGRCTVMCWARINQLSRQLTRNALTALSSPWELKTPWQSTH